jgi:hypothetical protein
MPKWPRTLTLAQVRAFPPEVSKTAPQVQFIQTDCGSEWIDAYGHSLPVKTAVVASCDSTSTPAADRSLSKRLISRKPRAACRCSEAALSAPVT